MVLFFLSEVLSLHATGTMDGIAKADLAGYAALFFLRLIQLSTVAISCFSVCYLIYMHNHHPCTWNPYYCQEGTINAGNQQVPLVEVVMVVTVRNHTRTPCLGASAFLVPLR